MNQLEPILLALAVGGVLFAPIFIVVFWNRRAEVLEAFESHSKYVSHNDSGYTKICGKCAERWAFSQEACGQERELEIRDCPDCRRKLLAVAELRKDRMRKVHIRRTRAQILRDRRK